MPAARQRFRPTVDDLRKAGSRISWISTARRLGPVPDQVGALPVISYRIGLPREIRPDRRPCPPSDRVPKPCQANVHPGNDLHPRNPQASVLQLPNDHRDNGLLEPENRSIYQRSIRRLLVRPDTVRPVHDHPGIDRPGIGHPDRGIFPVTALAIGGDIRIIDIPGTTTTGTGGRSRLPVQ